MKKLLLFFFALLCIGGKAWAETFTWTSGVSVAIPENDGNYSTGWFTAIAPFHGTISSFQMILGTNSGGSPSVTRTNAYLAISKDLKSTTSNFSDDDFVAISTNECGSASDGKLVTMNFDNAELIGGVTYYFYFVQEDNKKYTLVNQRYYVDTSKNGAPMTFGLVGSTSGTTTEYTVPFTTTMTLVGGNKYRIKALYPDPVCYIYSSSSDENKIFKSSSSSTPSLNDTRYIWEAKPNSAGVILQNIGSTHYIAKISGSNAGATYLNATTEDYAEKFLYIDNTPTDGSNKAGYIGLKSQTAGSKTYLNTYTSGNDYVGSYTANNNRSGQFFLQLLKQVTFSPAVAVNGGSAVSTIYVACDGSDSGGLTLDANKYYRIGGEGYYASAAATAITAAGTSDIDVTVEDLPTYTVTYTCKNLSGYQLASSTQDCAIFTPPTIEGYTLDGVYDDTDADFDYVNTVITAAKTLTVKYRLTNNPISGLESTEETKKWVVLEGWTGDGYYQLINWNGSQVAFRGAESTFPYATPDNYLWAFIGNESTGYYIQNKGTGKYFGGDLGTTADGDFVGQGDAKTRLWEFRYSYNNSAKTTKAITLCLVGSGQGMNRGSSRPQYYNYQTMTTVMNVLTLYQTNYPYAGIASRADWVGGYSTANITAAQTAVGNAEPTNVDDYATYVSTLGSKISLADGGYYYIQGNTSNSRLRTMAGTPSHVSVSSKTGNDGIATEVWKITSAPNSKYYIQNVASGEYMGTIGNGNSGNTPMSESPVAINIESYGYDYANTFYTTSGGQNYIHESTSYTYGIIGWNQNSDNSKWNIIPADLSTFDMISPSAVATDEDVYMSYANNTGAVKQMPADVTVYKVLTGGTKEDVTLTEVSSKVVPDGEGVILKAKRGATIPLLPTSTSETLEGNVLVAGDGTDVDGFLLAYKNGEDTPKFFVMSGLTLDDDKAYLPSTYFDPTVKELRLTFDDETTSIRSIEKETMSGAIYNLNGQRIGNAQLKRGIYIVNGKKIMVK